MDNHEVHYRVKQLGLQPHPEGGYFREVYRSNETITKEGLPERFTAPRSIITSIYYLLEAGDYSAFHRIKSDETWYYHTGGTLAVHMLKDGNYKKVLLGSNTAEGEVFQYSVPFGTNFAAEPVAGDYVLVSCAVAPGFDFEDFEMADAVELKKNNPDYADLITRLSR